MPRRKTTEAPPEQLTLDDLMAQQKKEPAKKKPVPKEKKESSPKRFPEYLRKNVGGETVGVKMTGEKCFVCVHSPDGKLSEAAYSVFDTDGVPFLYRQKFTKPVIAAAEKDLEAAEAESRKSHKPQEPEPPKKKEKRKTAKI